MFHAGQQHWGRQRQDPAEVLAVDGCFHNRSEEGFMPGQGIPRRQSQTVLVLWGQSAAIDE